MQKENTEFDLLVRSMMQDAEEPVSPRVWDAVSAGLDARTRKPVVLRWRRVAAGIAAAAAVAVGAILLGTRDNSNLPHHIDTVAHTLATPASGPAEEATVIPETNAIPSESAAPAAPKKAVRPALTAAQPEAELPAAPVAEEETVIPEEPVYESIPAEETVPAEVILQQDARTALAEEKTWEDPFAQMEREDAQQSGGSRISLSAGSTFQSNGNPSSTFGFGGMRAPANTEREHTVIEQTSRDATYAIPFSAGLGLRIGLSPRWAIGTGVNWTLLQRSFSGIYREEGQGPVGGDIHHTIQYIGVPVNLSYMMIDNRRISLYTFGGGTIEKAVSNKFSVDGKSLTHKEGVDGFQWSAGVGLGVQFQLTDFLGLYIDPSLRYYFKGNQPTSIRTQQPLMMNFEVGLRWDL